MDGSHYFHNAMIISQKKFDVDICSQYLSDVEISAIPMRNLVKYLVAPIEASVGFNCHK